ncbi:MAG TPA: class I tRNA ligase family protein, partial [Nitrososphaerales archaeon]|nr:class I tRNA ligase family protein [Nitrososphaerales archaeon]
MTNQLRLYNTLTRRVQPFQSLAPGRVKMFVCGPTIQDYIHLGHARTYLFYDMLSRYLSYLGYSVSFVVNITDVDEGIVKGARARGLPLDEFTSKYERGFVEDMGKLGIKSVSHFDRVTSHIPEMI